MTTQLDMFTPADAGSLLRAARALMECGADKMTVSSWDAAKAYLHLTHGNPRNEVFRVLFLDRKNRLIADQVMGTGTVDHCPAYPREILRAAIMADACALILCHNHPSGDPTPSAADIAMTKQIMTGAEAIGIAVHDHIIIGDGCEASLRGLDLI